MSKNKEKSTKPTKDSLAKRMAKKARSGSMFKLTAGVVKLFAMVTVGYSLSLLIALNMIPYMSAVVGQSVGITVETAIPDMFAFWILPMGFIVIVLIIAFVLVMRSFWNFMTRKFNKMIEKRMEQLDLKYGDDK